MPLTPGTRLGPYEILAPIGAGGMGEVYRARDTRLCRDVALKILPEEADASRRARFEQEARAVAALNHPNIVAVYDVGDGYMVGELVDGETLRAAKFGLRKTLDIAGQIASGLAIPIGAGPALRNVASGYRERGPRRDCGAAVAGEGMGSALGCGSGAVDRGDDSRDPLAAARHCLAAALHSVF